MRVDVPSNRRGNACPESRERPRVVVQRQIHIQERRIGGTERHDMQWAVAPLPQRIGYPVQGVRNRADKGASKLERRPLRHVDGEMNQSAHQVVGKRLRLPARELATFAHRSAHAIRVDEHPESATVDALPMLCVVVHSLDIVSVRLPEFARDCSFAPRRSNFADAMGWPPRRLKELYSRLADRRRLKSYRHTSAPRARAGRDARVAPVSEGWARFLCGRLGTALAWPTTWH